jgi:hypothetical protein
LRWISLNSLRNGLDRSGACGRHGRSGGRGRDLVTVAGKPRLGRRIGLEEIEQPRRYFHSS